MKPEVHVIQANSLEDALKQIAAIAEDKTEPKQEEESCEGCDGCKNRAEREALHQRGMEILAESEQMKADIKAGKVDPLDGMTKLGELVQETIKIASRMQELESEEDKAKKEIVDAIAEVVFEEVFNEVGKADTDSKHRKVFEAASKITIAAMLNLGLVDLSTDEDEE